MERTKIIDFGKHSGWSKSGKNRIEIRIKKIKHQNVPEYIIFYGIVLSKKEENGGICEGNIMENLHEFCPELRNNPKFMEIYSLSKKYNGSYTEEIPPSDMAKIEAIIAD